MMWWQITLMLPIALSTLAIRVPVDDMDVIEKKTTTKSNRNANKKQDTFYIPDTANVDSYLIPPDPHRLEEVLFEDIVTPATFLLPPSPEKQVDYYMPTEPRHGQQTDWYPIVQSPLQSTPVLTQTPTDLLPIVVPDNDNYSSEQSIVDIPRGGKAYGGERFVIPLPSRELEPPKENASNDYTLSSPSGELELPSEEVNQQFKEPLSPSKYQLPAKVLNRKNTNKNLIRIKEPEPTIALHLTPPPPKPITLKYKNPTKLYPKKFNRGFHPVPIPLAQFAGDPSHVPRARPVKPFKPVVDDESENFAPDDKKVYLYEQAQEKRKLKAEHESESESRQQPTAEDAHVDNVPAEPLTSETSFKHPTRNIHPSRLRQPPPAPGPPEAEQPKKVVVPQPPPDGERTEFRMHGMKGPESYQFGYDTGKGKNRQFRYEERDNEGRVKGHYGYMDNEGKMRVVNYDADPEKGFHAEAPQEAEP